MYTLGRCQGWEMNWRLLNVDLPVGMKSSASFPNVNQSGTPSDVTYASYNRRRENSNIQGLGWKTNTWNTFVGLKSDGKQPFRYEKLRNFWSDGELVHDDIIEPPSVRYPQRNCASRTQKSTRKSARIFFAKLTQAPSVILHKLFPEHGRSRGQCGWRRLTRSRGKIRHATYSFTCNVVITCCAFVEVMGCPWNLRQRG